MPVIKAPYELTKELLPVMVPTEAIPPTPYNIGHIQRGDFIKVALVDPTKVNGAELFWVMVITREGSIIKTKVNQDLVLTKYHGIKDEDVLFIGRENVLAILKG